MAAVVMVSQLRDGADCAGVRDTKPLRTRDEAVARDTGCPAGLVEQVNRLSLYRLLVTPGDQTWKQGVACHAFPPP
jgi:hypothetical protein